MTKKIKLFLPTPAYEEMMKQYKDRLHELRKALFTMLMPLAKQAADSKMKKILQLNVFDKNNRPAVEDIPFSETDIDKNVIGSTPEYVPDEFTGKDSDFKTFEFSVSDRFYDELKFFGTLYCTRMQLHNGRLDEKDPDYKIKFGKMPTCIEEVIQNGIMVNLVNHITSNIEKSLTDEFDKINPIETKPEIKGSRN